MAVSLLLVVDCFCYWYVFGTVAGSLPEAFLRVA